MLKLTLLVLHLGIISRKLEWSYMVLDTKVRLVKCKASVLLAVIFLWSLSCFFCLLDVIEYSKVPSFFHYFFGTSWLLELAGISSLCYSIKTSIFLTVMWLQSRAVFPLFQLISFSALTEKNQDSWQETANTFCSCFKSSFWCIVT